MNAALSASSVLVSNIIKAPGVYSSSFLDLSLTLSVPAIEVVVSLWLLLVCDFRL